MNLNVQFNFSDKPCVFRLAKKKKQNPSFENQTTLVALYVFDLLKCTGS